MDNNKRKNVYITIFVITTVIAGCIAVYFSIMESKISQENQNLQTKVEELTANAQDAILQEQSKIQEEITKVDESSQANNQSEELSQNTIDKIAKSTIEDYMNIVSVMFASDGGTELNYLGFANTNTKYVEDRGVYTTNVKYQDFINKVTEYMTKELFEASKYSKSYSNNNGNLEIIAKGATQVTYYVRDIELVSKSNGEYVYNCKYSHSVNVEETSNDEFTIKKVNNEYVVSKTSMS